MTIVTAGSDDVIEQITKHLNRLIDVVKVVDLTESPCIERELMLIKVRAVGKERDEMKRMAEIFRGRIVDVTEKTYTIELTGQAGKLDAFIDAIDRTAILETVRTGASGIARGERITAIAHATALRRSRTQSDEQERLDRLIHDNVMAALLDASRAPGAVSKRTRELAMRALSVLEFEEKRATGTATTYVHTLLDDLLDALTPWRSRVRFNVLVPDIRPAGHTRAFLPSDTGQALIHAVTEAVSNSARHSGVATTFVTMDGGACPPTAHNPFGFYLSFEVLDRGKGFQMRSMDSRRLGVRVSIIGNVENAGGRVEVASAPHRGTRIQILWPSDASPSD